MYAIHRVHPNLIARILKVDTFATQDGIVGYHEQNKYILMRRDGTKEVVKDGELAYRLHLVDITMMKRSFDKEKGNTKSIRRALHSLSEAGIKLFKRITLTDFDLCINHELINQRKVPMSSPDTSIPPELEREARTGVIFEDPELSIVFRDHDKKKALFRVKEICRYSNQTLKYIKDCMNKKQERSS
ncbi:hypothetical protein Hanom_Chr06g00547071 [Helianthus anomalus]